MAGWLLFITSPAVTPELVRELQSADKGCPVPNAFVPARPLEAQKPVSREEVDDHVEVFDHASNEELQRLHDERMLLRDDRGREFLGGGDFIVLDARSARDKTAVVHGEVNEFKDFDDGRFERVGKHWETWRLPMPDCWNFIAVKSWETEIEEFVFVKEKERFTNPDGVFQVKAALDWYGGDSVEEQA